MSLSVSKKYGNRQKLHSRQKGISLIAAMIIIALALFLGAFVFAVGPSYYRYFTVTNIVKDAVNDPKLMAAKKRDIYAHIKQAYRTNDLWDFELDKTVKVSKDTKGNNMITIDYEERNKFIGNMEVVTKFQREVVQP